MSAPIKDALALIAAAEAGKPVDNAVLIKTLWQLVNALRRP